MQLIGLDVGFSATRPTSAVATLAGTALEVGRASASTENRRRLWNHVSTAAVVAIDAPLLPACDARVRLCERLFARGQFQRRCKPGFSHVAGTGLELRRAGTVSAAQLEHVASKNPAAVRIPLVLSPLNLIEAFPNAFLGVCVSEEQYASKPLLKRGKKFDWLYGEWCRTGKFRSLVGELASVLPKPVASLCENNHDHEERAALVCLLTAASAAAGRYTAVGEPSGGYFFLPSWSLWAGWARTELNRQRDLDPSIAVWIDGVSFRASETLP